MDPLSYEVGSDLSLSGYAHGLVGEWKFDDANGGIGSQTTDASGLGNDGTLSDTSSTGLGPTYESSGCIIGGCLSFDGASDNDDYVDVQNAATLSPGNAVTMIAWIKAASTNRGYAGIIDKEDGTTSGYITMVSSTTFYVAYSHASNGNDYLSVSVPFADNAWHMVAGVIDTVAGSEKLYFDGELRKSKATTPGERITDTNHNLEIGARRSGSAFPGTIDNARIYTARSLPTKSRPSTTPKSRRNEQVSGFSDVSRYLSDTLV